MARTKVKENRKTRVGAFATHPIQYQIPVWRRLANRVDDQLMVYYFSDQGLGSSVDPEFGHAVKWDTPLLDGYRYEFISKESIEGATKFFIPGASHFLAKQQLDVVILHGYTHRFARQIIRHKRRLGYKVILRGEFSDMRRRAFDWKRIARQAYLRWFYAYVDHFCPIGLDAIDHLTKQGIESDRMTLSPYSVDGEYFEEQSKNLSRAECRSRLAFSDDQLVLLFSGKLIPRKQPMLLAHAIAKIADKYPQLAVIYLGSGPQLDELRNMLAPRLGNRFRAPGFVNQSELGAYFKAADVFVLPSKFDTWGLVVNEAMHFGLPCIVSDAVGCRRDLVKEGENGYVFSHDSIDELAFSIERFLIQEDLAKRMGENSRSHIQNYSVAHTVAGLESAIRKTTIYSG